MMDINNSLREAMGLTGECQPIVSLVGAGGKTTTICRLTEEYKKENIPVIVTTTTQMYAEEKPWFLMEPSISRAREILKKEGMVWMGMPCQQGKMKALPVDFFAEVIRMGHPILIEADGAKGMSIKAPAEHEPVLCPNTTHVVNVYGIDAVGKAWEQIGFRLEQIIELLDIKPWELVRMEDIVTLAIHPEAGKKCVSEKMKYHVLLNKVDGEKEKWIAEQIRERLEAHGFMEVVITGRQKKYEDID